MWPWLLRTMKTVTHVKTSETINIYSSTESTDNIKVTRTNFTWLAIPWSKGTMHMAAHGVSADGVEILSLGVECMVLGEATFSNFFELFQNSSKKLHLFPFCNEFQTFSKNFNTKSFSFITLQTFLVNHLIPLTSPPHLSPSFSAPNRIPLSVPHLPSILPPLFQHHRPSLYTPSLRHLLITSFS